MKYLFIGFGISLIIFVVALTTNDWSLLYKITGFVGLICLGIGALISGAFISGDRLGRNLNSESETDRRKRITFTNRIVLIGAPNIAFAIILFLLLN
ncbi:DUF5316 domain-containing protein [Chungangia koreensis]|uniref:DUF5316 domain-containing protein n=1 Tax=Chungangia koreensis TaxID=752657 RepID=A0ABV8X0R2_9LACT